MQVRKQQLELDLKQWTGSKLGEGTEPGNRGLDEGHVRAGGAQRGRRPPGLCSSHGSRPARAVVLPPNHAVAASQECGPARMGCGKGGRGAASACPGAWGLRRAWGLDVLMG